MNEIRNKLVLSTSINKYLDNSYVVKEDNKNDSHAFVANQVENNSKVLDIGCAQGVIGIFLKNEKKCDIDGIEINEEAVKQALKINAYTNIYTFNIENENDSDFKKLLENGTKYDYIIFADVLEHVYNPLQVLINAGKLLKSNGKIIISIPNMAHSSIIIGLLNNDLNYDDMGLLDNTHIRFFTKVSFAKMIEEINNLNLEFKFDCEYIKSTIKENNNSLAKECLDDSFNEFQHIFKLTKIKQNEECKELEKIIIHYSKKYELPHIKKIEQLENEKAFLKTEINNIVNSKSWKITKPLRFRKHK